MPWQRAAVDVGLELVENDAGMLVPAYREVICTVMRQNGKSTLLFSVIGHRCAMWPTLPQRAIYTAQDGTAARKKLIEDCAPLYTGSPLVSKLIERVYKGVGYEGINWRTGSTVRIIGSSEAAGHGNTSVGIAGIDESFADVDFRREQAIAPSMATVADAQVWNVSTAGTDASVFLRSKIDAGRAAAAAGRTSGICYIEYSIPDDADCDDPETWWTHMPAMGWTITPDVVAHARQTMPDGEWRRSFGNQWTTTDERTIPPAIWAGAQSASATVDRATVFAVEVHPERSWASIAASDGAVVELIDRRPGVAWVVDRLVDLATRYSVPVALDGGGPAGVLADDLEARNVTVVRLGTREVVAACGGFYDALAGGTVTVRTDADLNAAVESVAKRQVSDAFVWSRRSADVDVTPLMAVSIARHAALTAAPTPFFAY